MATLVQLQSELTKLTDEATAIREDLNHRELQKNAWLGVRRSYSSSFQYQGGKGKYFDFGGRKSNYATQGQAKTAEYYLTEVIPQEVKKLNDRFDIVIEKIIEKKKRWN